MNEAIITRGLVKKYGRHAALNGFTLAVPSGSITGLVGRNGAGKTTWMMTVAGFVIPDAGEVSILGSGPFDARRHGGRFTILPQDSDLPNEGRVRSLLVSYARLQFLELAQNNIMKGLELSGIGGIETWRDALEYIQIGCRNVQVCTAVMQYGYRIIDDLILGMQTYLTERSLAAGKTITLEDIVGEQLPSFVLPSELDRETMVLPKIDREKCIGCGRCHISCTDGGHQAIEFDLETRQPRIIGTKCVGCHLCRLVCPTGAIGLSKRFNKIQK